MKRTVRFVSDTESYAEGDFGDMGKETLKAIEAGDTIVVGMLVFDADAVEEQQRRWGTAHETAVHLHTIDSLWCIVVSSSAINDCDKDITDPALIKDDYLRTLAVDSLLPASEGR